MFVGEKYLNRFFRKLYALYNDCQCFSRRIIMHLAKNISSADGTAWTG